MGENTWQPTRHLRRGCSSSTTSRTSSSCWRPACGSRGFEVTTATNGREALAEARRFRPDLVVLDVMMPDMDGFDVVRRMRGEGARTPVLFLTARDATEDKVAGLTVGGDDYVTKPFSLEEIIARIRAVLRRAGGRGRRRHGGRPG